MIREALQHIIDTKTKPPGALGSLESIALQAGLLQNTTSPAICSPHIVVFAADHGIAATGLVNPYPQAVTAQMVKNFLAGGAAINVFCRQNNIKLKIVDAGVKCDWTEDELKHPGFLVKKLAYQTNNYLQEPAMTVEEAQELMHQGREVVKAISATGCNTIGFGEMGIGNTSGASLIMSSMLGLQIEQCVGRGTGANEQQLQTKINTLQKAAALHKIAALKEKPHQLLATVGGFEIAMLCGAYLEAAAQSMLILVDGFIATSALLIAQCMQPQILQNCLFAHCSNEQGHKKMLEHFNAQPLLNLGLRLGEGTGAALALPLVQAAVNFVNQMASFASAGVNQSA